MTHDPSTTTAPVPYSRRRLLAVGLSLPLAVPAWGRRSAEPPGVALSGTFLQLLAEHQKWTPEQWAHLFEALRRLQLTTLIVQWAQSGGQRFYGRQDGGAQGQPERQPAAPPGLVGARAPLEMILELAQKSNIRVLLGLVLDPQYWQQIAQPPEAVAAYLAQRESQTLQTATELVPLARSSAAFAGWFMNEEIDDINWQEPAARAVLSSYLHRVSDYLRLLLPHGAVALSGFSNAHATPAQLQEFWQGLLRAAPAIDTVLFQDGIGAHKLTLETLPQYLHAVRAATDAAGRRLWSVTELFEQTGGAGSDAGPFRASAAPFARVAAQLRIEAQCGAAQIAFSAADYMLAPTHEAQGLLASYLQYIRA